MTAFRQLKSLLKKDFILARRHLGSTLVTCVFAPLFILLLLWILQASENASLVVSNFEPSSYSLPKFQACPGNCISLMFNPVTENVINVMRKFAELNGGNVPYFPQVLQEMKAPIAPIGIVGVPSEQFMYQYILLIPNKTYFGVTFSSVGDALQYQIWYNFTLTVNKTSDGLVDPFGSQLLSLLKGIDEAIISVFGNGGDATIDVTLKDWPEIPSPGLSNRVIAQFGKFFVFCASIFVFMTSVNQIMFEKESKLRIAMEYMGLSRSMYWISWFIFHSILSFGNSISIYVFGFLFRFLTFTGTNIFIMISTLWIFSMAMVCMGYLITTFTLQAKTAILFSIVTFVCGLIFQVIVFSDAYIAYIWWDSVAPSILLYIFYCFPFFNFGKLLFDICTYSEGRFDPITEMVVPGPGFGFRELFSDLPKAFVPTYRSQSQQSVPRPIISLLILLANMIGYFVLALYFDAVIPNAYGKRKNPFFFLWPFRGSFLTSQSSSTEDLKDIDLILEHQNAHDRGKDFAVRIVDLTKVYPGNKTAVKSLCLTLEEGKLLSLLGQNGAGKSTLQNILAGGIHLTSGDAFIFGDSVRNGLSKIRLKMGVCPQFDMLFDDLTGMEHVQFFAGLKGIEMDDTLKCTMDERIAQVRLSKAANTQTKSYSGGMRRRLSVILSTIGDPQVLFLDEPTTGMDPVNRRYVWSFIEKFKLNRIVILTTHSMEEADVLGDRIAIMSKGKIRALGSSIHLKSKFGTGYRINIILRSAKSAPKTKNSVSKMVPLAVLEDESACSLIYQFPKTAFTSIPKFVDFLERNPDGDIEAWGISHSTLEEVFLKVIRMIDE